MLNQKNQLNKDWIKFEQNIPGEVIKSGSGEFYLIRPDIMGFCNNADALIDRYKNAFDAMDKSGLGHELKLLLSARREDIVFLDIETTGLSNTPLFLIGLLYFKEDKIFIDQLFARDYSEEAHLLNYFSEFVPNFGVLVTFNGKSFDIPYIRNRMIFHRKFLRWSHLHVDILQHSRKKWRGYFPDCKLQTLEYFVCRRRRENDIPSALVPDIYHDFVRTGNIEHISGVFYHNALDLITLMELTLVLLSQEDD